MAIELNSAILEFLISSARSRADRHSTVAPTACDESTAIFDELDSLSADEFALIYAVYLLGSGAVDDPAQAAQNALVAAFAPLEAMAIDANLHIALSRGLDKWRQHPRRS